MQAVPAVQVRLFSINCCVLMAGICSCPPPAALHCPPTLGALAPLLHTAATPLPGTSHPPCRTPRWTSSPARLSWAAAAAGAEQLACCWCVKRTFGLWRTRQQRRLPPWVLLADRPRQTAEQTAASCEHPVCIWACAACPGWLIWHHSRRQSAGRTGKMDLPTTGQGQDDSNCIGRCHCEWWLIHHLIRRIVECSKTDSADMHKACQMGHTRAVTSIPVGAG